MAAGSGRDFEARRGKQVDNAPAQTPRGGNPLIPLSGLDALFLHLETPETPMHVASLHLYDLPEGYRGDFYANVKQQIAWRLHLVPLFRRKLRTLPFGFANPVWQEDAGIDLDYHVRRVVLRRPGTQAQLEGCAARIHSTLLDRSRPLWEAHIIEGLKSGQVAFYMRVHHAVLDGAAGMALTAALLDPTPVPRKVPRPPGEKRMKGDRPGATELAGAALRHDVAQYAKLVRQLPDLVRILTGTGPRARGPVASAARRSLAFGPRTPLNVSITGERRFAAVSLSLDEAKIIALGHDAKVNDVVLAICSGALRKYLSTHGGIPDEPLIAGMPFSLRESGNIEYSTQATMTLVNLATEIADPVQRLRAIRDAAGAIKSVARRAKSVIPVDTPSLGAPWLVGGLATLYGRTRIADFLRPIMNVVISNVPGPAEPLYAAGARMRTYWPLSIVEHGMGLNITVVSYCDALDFGLVAARRAMPDVRELARALEEAHAELLRLSGKRDKPEARQHGGTPAHGGRKGAARL
jgi:WS/DGAT/MGAT family acyltransferase